VVAVSRCRVGDLRSGGESMLSVGCVDKSVERSDCSREKA
jgi:hypothetical protein